MYIPSFILVVFVTLLFGLIMGYKIFVGTFGALMFRPFGYPSPPILHTPASNSGKDNSSSFLSFLVMLVVIFIAGYLVYSQAEIPIDDLNTERKADSQTEKQASFEEAYHKVAEPEIEPRSVQSGKYSKTPDAFMPVKRESHGNESGTPNNNVNQYTNRPPPSNGYSSTPVQKYYVQISSSSNYSEILNDAEKKRKRFGNYSIVIRSKSDANHLPSYKILVEFLDEEEAKYFKNIHTKEGYFTVYDKDLD